jgi:succinate dehydrogenase / fumarate reductase, cytochrome b subunit
MVLVNKKPVYLNLFQFKFPATAIASILHRLSGVVLFLALPLVIWALSQSLQSEEAFLSLKNCLMHPFVKWIWAALLVGLYFHLIAGIRHMIMDMGYGDGKCSGRLGAYLVMGLTALFAIWLGVSLW